MKNRKDFITLAHGNGGRLTHDLVNNLFVKSFANPYLESQLDSALLPAGENRLAFTTDSFVVKPLFFPGGDIGKLAVCGTVNDLAVMGAVPLFLSCAMIIEEGFPLAQLEQITQSIQQTAHSANVQVVTGDTKVVEKGMADGLFITTSGIGMLTSPGITLSPDRVTPGDKVIINGTIGDHGIAVLTARGDFPLSSAVKSDCAPLNGLTSALSAGIPPAELKMLRDPTRGGVATTLNEFTQGRDFGILIEETALPLQAEVSTIAEMTGFDPLYIANEGKLLIVVSAAAEKQALEILQQHPLGVQSRTIGEVMAEHRGQVVLRSRIGGKRIVDMLVGDMLPRIC